MLGGVLQGKVSKLLACALPLALLSPAFYFAYHQIYLKGLQAEAHIILSELHALQSVYKAESGSYASFEDYGAPVRGIDHCRQPHGAAQLGFAIRGCHDMNATMPRYVYRSQELSSGASSFRLDARSGSDEQGRSLICFRPQAEENWEFAERRSLKLVKSCW